jgi:hypothetical protein
MNWPSSSFSPTLAVRAAQTVSAEFQHEYAKLSDNELLLLASDRQSLTDDAKSALDSAMRNRNLTPIDLAKQESFVRRSNQRERIIRARKLFGSRRGIRDWLQFVLWSLLLIVAAASLALWLDAHWLL